MTTPLRHIARIAVAAALCATARAASVSPATASHYYFSTPRYPSAIRGEVRGVPPAYLDIRSEDVDWLLEASAERLAIRGGELPEPRSILYPEFGRWALSETNRFYRWATAVDAAGVTNVVVGYNYVTNFPPILNANTGLEEPFIFAYAYAFESAYGYLDGDTALLGSPRAFDYYDAPLFTNVYSRLRLTNGVVDRVSTIEMPMTNGTVSVHTNKWRATTRHYFIFSVTNVSAATYIDYCHDGHGAFPPYSIDIPYSGTTWSYSYSIDAISNAYNCLRGTSRLADARSPTNMAESVYHSYLTLENDDGWTTRPRSALTNTTVIANYTISGSNISWTYDVVGDDQYHHYYSISSDEDRTSPYEAIAPTRFPSAIVTTGNVVRVEIEAAYAILDFSYSKWHEEFLPSSPSSHNVLDAYTRKVVAIPLANAVLDLSHQYALARVQLDMKALCRAASSAAGAPTPPESANGYSPPIGESHYWNAEISSIVLIYKIHPSSKFNDWP